MKAIRFCVFTLMIFPVIVTAQQNDTTVKVEGTYITLSEVIINQKLDVASFIARVKADTTFYKAFKNLRIVGYTSINDIRMLGKRGKLQASLNGKSKQIVENGCRKMEVISQKTTGNFYDSKGDYNYYTASMYAQLFFTNGTVCGENNIVGNNTLNSEGLSGMEKHKAQLKMLFFNPGRRIKGLPLISSKTAIFDRAMIGNYNMRIDFDDNLNAYIFRITVKPGRESNVVIKEMTTWFDQKNFEVLARNYSLKYDASVYSFDVQMKVRMTRFNGLLIPNLISYNGSWKIMFKKKETGIFTATLSDFNR
ncbi:MAG: hypothetical protein H3C36_11900 [Chitinophagaceae bacterium]|nr:hypothetical protein [Chitinophagaceae bacterium]MCZ2395732.1 hypothetical protein [Chitinophagales bacterium]